MFPCEPWILGIEKYLGLSATGSCCYSSRVYRRDVYPSSNRPGLHNDDVTGSVAAVSESWTKHVLPLSNGSSTNHWSYSRGSEFSFVLLVVIVILRVKFSKFTYNIILSDCFSQKGNVLYELLLGQLQSNANYLNLHINLAEITQHISIWHSHPVQKHAPLINLSCLIRSRSEDFINPIPNSVKRHRWVAMEKETLHHRTWRRPQQHPHRNFPLPRESDSITTSKLHLQPDLRLIMKCSMTDRNGIESIEHGSAIQQQHCRAAKRQILNDDGNGAEVQWLVLTLGRT